MSFVSLKLCPTGPLWWLIFCVNITRLRDAHLAGKTIFLGVSVSVSREEIAFELATE